MPHSATTHDLVRGGTGATLHFYHTEQISDNQHLTPEGYLVCSEVGIARTGEMIYHKSEVPVTAGTSDMITIDRTEAEVFAPDTLASFMGKPVTDDHPTGGVNATTWKTHAVGTVMNVRRGTGDRANHIIADLLITDADAIKAVRAGKVEVSCGYDAEYIQTAPGRGMQTKIIGNHVALVEHGRCGSTCSIKDKDFKMEVSDIKDAVKSVFADMFGAKTATADCQGDKLAAVNDELTKVKRELAAMKDKAAKDEEEEEEEEAKKKAAEEKKKEEDEEAEAEKAKENEKSKDSYAAILANAEILSPGIVLPKPTGDMTVKDADTLKRLALDTALKMETGQKAIAPILVGRAVDTLSGDALDIAFKSSATVAKTLNKAKPATKDTAANYSTHDGIKQVYADFWKNKQGVN